MREKIINAGGINGNDSEEIETSPEALKYLRQTIERHAANTEEITKRKMAVRVIKHEMKACLNKKIFDQTKTARY